MFAVGVTVRVKAPFSEMFPDVYVIEAQSPTGAWQLAGGLDFDEDYLEIV